MTRKSKPEKIRWTTQSIQAFNKLQEILLTAPVMMNPDFSCPLILQTNALDVGVGAVLSQTDTKGMTTQLLISDQQENTTQRAEICYY